MRIAALALALSALLAMGFAAPPPVSAGCATQHIAVAAAIQSDSITIADGATKTGNATAIALVGAVEIIPKIIPAAASPPAPTDPRAYILTSSPTTRAEAGPAPNIVDATLNERYVAGVRRQYSANLDHPLRR